MTDPTPRPEHLTDEQWEHLAEQLYAERDQVEHWEEVEMEVDPNLTHVFSVRLRKGELSKVVAAAQAAGLPPSVYMRNASLAAAEGTVPVIDRDALIRQALAVREAADRLLRDLA